MTWERSVDRVPDAHAAFDDIRGMLWNRRIAVFLDFDGTLSPIVDDPAAAQPAAGVRVTLARLVERCAVAVISGRDVADVGERVAVDHIWYAGSHGFDIAGPDGERHQYERALDVVPALDAAEEAVRERLRDIAGVQVERKRFSLSVHFRSVEPDDVPAVTAAVDDVGSEHHDLRMTEGRRLFELGPNLEWDKGAALTWLLEHVEPSGTAFPIYAGDDETDEDALRVVRGIGLGIVVRSEERGAEATSAHVAVDGPDQLCELLVRIHALFESGELGPA